MSCSRLFSWLLVTRQSLYTDIIVFIFIHKHEIVFSRRNSMNNPYIFKFSEVNLYIFFVANYHSYMTYLRFIQLAPFTNTSPLQVVRLMF